MGILSGMLLACGIAYFSKKKLIDKNASIDENKSPSMPPHDESNASIDEHKTTHASNEPIENESNKKID